MGRSLKLNKKRCFRGNQHEVSARNSNSFPCEKDNSVETVSDSLVSGEPNLTIEQGRRDSASKRKLPHVTNPSSNECSGTEPDVSREETNRSGNIIIDLQILGDFIKKFTQCKSCGGDIDIYELLSSRKGLASKLELSCNQCKFSETTMTSNITRNRLYSTNISLVYGLRCIGKGYSAAKTLCAMMNLPKPPVNFLHYNKKIGLSLKEVCNASMKSAATEAMEINESKDIVGAFDGSWQKRGHTSLNGVVTVTSVDTGKVMDVEVMTKRCQVCQKGKHNQDEHPNCKKNYTGTSGGMEVAGALEIFKRSKEDRGVRYVGYLGDGDSKAYNKVVQEEPYGKDVTISKLECIGHVQKRMGTRLRRLCKEKKGEKLVDGKGLNGRGRLTDSEVDKLQLYYGMAIRRNSADVKAMMKDIWAIFFHKLSTNEKPQHGLCPPGEQSWCKFNKAKASGAEHDHTHSLPVAVMQAIKPVFKDLTKEELLKKCLHGRTQNPNESFNAVIWNRLPKTVYVGYDTMCMGVFDAVICFNGGVASRQHVLEQLGMEVGRNTRVGLAEIDTVRVKKAEDAVELVTKQARISQRNKKRRSDEAEDPDDPLYGAGMH